MSGEFESHLSVPLIQMKTLRNIILYLPHDHRRKVSVSKLPGCPQTILVLQNHDEHDPNQQFGSNTALFSYTLFRKAMCLYIRFA